jgi:hypothetical protein
MDGHLVPASSNSKFRCSLENFTSDANAGSLLCTGVWGRVRATLQATLRQTAGCESLKNNSKYQATFQMPNG